MVLQEDAPAPLPAYCLRLWSLCTPREESCPNFAEKPPPPGESPNMEEPESASVIAIPPPEPKVVGLPSAGTTPPQPDPDPGDVHCPCPSCREELLSGLNAPLSRFDAWEVERSNEASLDPPNTGDTSNFSMPLPRRSWPSRAPDPIFATLLLIS